MITNSISMNNRSLGMITQSLQEIKTDFSKLLARMEQLQLEASTLAAKTVPLRSSGRTSEPSISRTEFLRRLEEVIKDHKDTTKDLEHRLKCHNPGHDAESYDSLVKRLRQHLANTQAFESIHAAVLAESVTEAGAPIKALNVP
jgi:antitoxin (DNA-binding transcriptional repressor) of toxin-antitoxin stability system